MALSILPPMQRNIQQNCDKRSDINIVRDISEKKIHIPTSTPTNNPDKIQARPDWYNDQTEKNKADIKTSMEPGVSNSNTISGKPWCAAFDSLPLSIVFHHLPMAKV